MHGAATVEKPLQQKGQQSSATSALVTGRKKSWLELDMGEGSREQGYRLYGCR